MTKWGLNPMQPLTTGNFPDWLGSLPPTRRKRRRLNCARLKDLIENSTEEFRVRSAGGLTALRRRKF